MISGSVLGIWVARGLFLLRGRAGASGCLEIYQARWKLLWWVQGGWVQNGKTACSLARERSRIYL